MKPKRVDTPGAAAPRKPAESVPQGPTRIYNANPVLPTRWSQDVPAARIEAAARTVSRPTLATLDGRRVGDISPLAARAPQEPHVIIAGTLDTKGEELRYIRDIIKAAGLRTRLVDLSTVGRNQGADVSAQEVALASPMGSAGIASGDRGTAVAAMTEAFRAWIGKQQNVAGIISAGGSGGTAIATAGMQMLPVGVPKIMISTMAAGNVAAYVGPTDITMMHSVTDVQGLNRVSRAVLGNGAHAMAAMARNWIEQNAPNPGRRAAADRPLVGMTMFGVTTPCVQQVIKLIEKDWEPLVFHATGIGGRSMEKLIDSGLMRGVIDVSTTEICDMMMGGILPATEDRFGAIIRTRLPYVASVGALDMVNFGPPDTVPGALPQPHPLSAQSAGHADAHHGGREPADGALDWRETQPDGRPRALPAAGRRRFRARCAGTCLLGSGSGCRPVQRHRRNGAGDGQPADHPASAPHQRSRFRRRFGPAFPRLAPEPLPRRIRQDLTDAQLLSIRPSRTLSRHDRPGRADRRRRVPARAFPPNARRQAGSISSSSTIPADFAWPAAARSPG